MSFVIFLCHSSHKNTPFFYQTNDNDILHRLFKDQVLGWYSVWRMLPGYAYLWHLSTWDMNDRLLAVVRVLKRHPHIPDHYYDKLRCKLTKTKTLSYCKIEFYLKYFLRWKSYKIKYLVLLILSWKRRSLKV